MFCAVCLLGVVWAIRRRKMQKYGPQKFQESTVHGNVKLDSSAVEDHIPAAWNPSKGDCLGSRTNLLPTLSSKKYGEPRKDLMGGGIIINNLGVYD